MSSADKIVSLNCQKFEVDGHWRAVAVTESGGRYEGKGWGENEAKDDAIACWHEAELLQTVDIDEKTSSLASKLDEQIVVMNELIEQAKTEGLDGRLIAMANTDFERGFMALEKALNINKR